MSYAVAKARLDREVWPIGWPPEKPQAEVLPALFEFRNVNVQNVSAARVMEAIGGQVKVPILLDHNALARHGVDPAKTNVSLPQQRTSYSLALRKLLVPGAAEVRDPRGRGRHAVPLGQHGQAGVRIEEQEETEVTEFRTLNQRNALLRDGLGAMGILPEARNNPSPFPLFPPVSFN